MNPSRAIVYNDDLRHAKDAIVFPRSLHVPFSQRMKRTGNVLVVWNLEELEVWCVEVPCVKWKATYSDFCFLIFRPDEHFLDPGRDVLALDEFLDLQMPMSQLGSSRSWNTKDGLWHGEARGKLEFALVARFTCAAVRLFNDVKAVHHTFVGALSVNVGSNRLGRIAFDFAVLLQVDVFLTGVALAIGFKVDVVFLLVFDINEVDVHGVEV